MISGNLAAELLDFVENILLYSKKSVILHQISNRRHYGKYFQHEDYLNKLIARHDNDEVKIITGPRR